jgi:ABC-type transport system substrate-binding protein
MRYKSTFLTLIMGVTFCLATPLRVLLPGALDINEQGGVLLGYDPARVIKTEPLIVCNNIYSNLVRYKNGTIELESGLARNWLQKSKTTYVFYLRKGVKFHDGKELDSKDVLYSFNRQRGKEDCIYWKLMGMDKLIKKVTASSKYIVQFELSKPNVTFLHLLAMEFAMIVNSRYRTPFRPIGTGPFILSKSEDGKLILKKHSKYWGEPSKFDIEFNTGFTNKNAKKFKKGEIDIIEMATPNYMKKLGEKAGWRLIKTCSLDISYLMFNTKRVPKKLRQVIARAIDRKKLIKKFYSEYAVLAKTFLPPLWSIKHKTKIVDYSLILARRIVKKYFKDRTLTLWTMDIPRSYNPAPKKMAYFIANELKKVGLKVEVVEKKWKTYVCDLRKGEHDMAILGWNADLADPDNFLFLLDMKDGKRKRPVLNFAFYTNKHFQKSIESARSNSKSRMYYYGKALDIINDDLPWLPISHNIDAVPVRNTIKKYKGSPIGQRKYLFIEK